METSKNRAFSVSEYKMFVYDYEMPRYVTTFDYIDGLYSKTFKLVKNGVEQQLPSETACKEPVSINEKKIQDIKKLERYIPSEATDFYQNMYIYMEDHQRRRKLISF
jgi:hypothetical protein